MNMNGHFTEERKGAMKITSLLIGELYRTQHQIVIENIEELKRIVEHNIFNENFEIGYFDICDSGIDDKIYYITPNGLELYILHFIAFTKQSQN